MLQSIKISKISLLFFLLCSCQLKEKSEQERFIYTVNGKIDVESLHFSLTHEHIMSNFGAEPNRVATYDRDLLFRQVIPYLKKVKASGVNSIFDCTAAYFGRDVTLLKTLSDSTGMHLITNTGFYGAANDKYVPQFAFNASAAEISNVWIKEFENGIDQTEIRPGFIKLAFDDGPPSEIDLKLFQAGILTHLKTGLSLVVHTGDNPDAASEQLRLLEENNVSPSAWIWAHANKAIDQENLIKAAQKGAWISLDGVNESNINDYVNRIEAFRKLGLLNTILLSHDGNSFPRGGEIRKYEAISISLIPRLKELGYSTEEINQLMIKNPQDAFSIKVRSIE